MAYLVHCQIPGTWQQAINCYCSVSQSCLTLRPHGLQHARLPCLSPSPGVCSNSCPLSRWCHPTISSSASPFSSCPQSTDIYWICVYVYVQQCQVLGCFCLFSHSVVSDSLWPCPWDSPGRNIKVGCHFLLQGIFPTQGLNLCLLHYRRIFYSLSHRGSLKF